MKKSASWMGAVAFGRLDFNICATAFVQPGNNICATRKLQFEFSKIIFVQSKFLRVY